MKQKQLKALWMGGHVLLRVFLAFPFRHSEPRRILITAFSHNSQPNYPSNESKTLKD